MHTSACFKTVNKCKISKFARFKFKDFSRIFKYFQAPYLFSSTFKGLEVFIPSSSIFKDFSMMLRTLLFSTTFLRGQWLLSEAFARWPHHRQDRRKWRALSGPCRGSWVHWAERYCRRTPPLHRAASESAHSRVAEASADRRQPGRDCPPPAETSLQRHTVLAL